MVAALSFPNGRFTPNVSSTELVTNASSWMNRMHARTHPEMNALVYSQLSMERADKDASHIVHKNKKTQDGYQAWQEDVMTYFHGSQRSIRTATSEMQIIT
jgi:hypothetical protein